MFLNVFPAFSSNTAGGLPHVCGSIVSLNSPAIPPPPKISVGPFCCSSAVSPPPPPPHAVSSDDRSFAGHLCSLPLCSPQLCTCCHFRSNPTSFLGKCSAGASRTCRCPNHLQVHLSPWSAILPRSPSAKHGPCNLVLGAAPPVPTIGLSGSASVAANSAAHTVSHPCVPGLAQS